MVIWCFARCAWAPLPSSLHPLLVDPMSAGSDDLRWSGRGRKKRHNGGGLPPSQLGSSGGGLTPSQLGGSGGGLTPSQPGMSTMVEAGVGVPLCHALLVEPREEPRGMASWLQLCRRGAELLGFNLS